MVPFGQEYGPINAQKGGKGRFFTFDIVAFVQVVVGTVLGRVNTLE